MLLSRPILTYGGGLLHQAKVGDAPVHELIIDADDGDDDDDSSIEDPFSGDPLVTVEVTSISAPDVRRMLPSTPPLRIPPHRPEPADHPPRLA